MNLLKNIIKNRGLILYLTKNDIKKKYAGSYLGIIWAFIQPIITILIYWFVFQVGLRVGNSGEHPFLLVLICGLIPWFFFSEAVSSATTCFLEYSYLVKKVVFDIDILPIVKILSALIVHTFFLILLIMICALFGYYPNASYLQIFYYVFCTFMLVFAISYLTSSLNVFFPDLAQIVTVCLQIGMWMTPIMWSYSQIQEYWYSFIFRMNPLFYIVEGYRSAILNERWFTDSPTLTLYFWGFVLVILFIGTKVFKKMKPHFSDSL